MQVAEKRLKPRALAIPADAKDDSPASTPSGGSTPAPAPEEDQEPDSELYRTIKAKVRARRDPGGTD